MITSRRQFIQQASRGAASVVLAGSAATALNASAGNGGNDITGHTDNNACNPLLSHELRPLMGPTRQPLCAQFADQVLLIVNTASRCGFTPQFEDLERLHQRYSNRGFQVLGFPSGDFRQELSSEAEVAEFCELNYGVTFPMFEKIHVTGDQAHPLYQQLAESTGTYPRWNFNKYLVDRSGNVVNHYQSGAMPMGKQMIADIESLL